MFTVAWDLHTTASNTEPLPLEIAFADILALATLDEALGITGVVDEASSSDGIFGTADNVGSVTEASLGSSKLTLGGSWNA